MGSKSLFYRLAVVGALALTMTTPAAARRARASDREMALVVERQFESRSPGVAILPFTPPREYLSGNDWRTFGTTAQQFLGDQLTNAGIPVVARGDIFNEMTAEQILALEGSVGQSAEFGRKTGAQYMLSGSVSSIDRRTISAFGVKYTEAGVNVSVRLLDVERGVFVKTYERTGKNRRLGPNLPAVVWSDSNVTDAIRKAVQDVARELVPYYQALPKSAVAVPGPPPTAPPALPAGGVTAKPWTVMVVIPETHLARPKVPDPAAETEIVSRLITAGYRVFDQARVAEIRQERWVQELYAGTATSAQMASIRSRYGVDVIVTGEGISERAEAPARGGLVISRGRVEIKAVFLETGEILSSRDEQQAGQDLSEIMASKLALRRAGATVSPKLIADLDQQCSRRCGGSANVVGPAAPASSPHSTPIDLEVAGWATLSGAREFLSSLNALKGIVSATQQEYRAGILFATIVVDGAAMKDLALELEENAVLKRFRVAVQTAGKSKIAARVK